MSGTIGNAIVIKKFVFTEKKDKPGSYLVAALAVVDMYSSIIIPFHYATRIIYDDDILLWPWGKEVCYLAHASDGMVYIMSAMFLAAISLERTR